MTIRPTLTLLALGLVAGCGASRPPAEATPTPLVADGELGCGLDVHAPPDEGAIVVLEESTELTGARQRYLIDGYGEIATSGSTMGPSALPARPDGAERAAQLSRELRATGVYALEPGCYAEELGAYDTHVFSLALTDRGRVLRFATTRGEGPLALRRAVALVQAYVNENLRTPIAEVRREVEVAPEGETTVTVVRQ